MTNNIDIEVKKQDDTPIKNSKDSLYYYFLSYSYHWTKLNLSLLIHNSRGEADTVSFSTKV